MAQINFLLALVFFLSSLFISCLNDVLVKYIFSFCTIDTGTIIFFRYFFSSLLLIPFLKFKLQTPSKRHFLIHILRGGILVGAIFLWNKGLRTTNIGTSTLMSLIEPMFVLILSPLILKEKSKMSNWLGTTLCLSGALIATAGDLWLKLNSSFCYLGISVFLFAVLDILFKKFYANSSFASTIFFSSLIPALFFLPFANFQLVDLKLLLTLFVLGIGNNLLILFMLKAYRYTSIVDLAPFKYFEVVLSMCLGYILFDEVPTLKFFLGGMLIFTSLFIFIYQKKNIWKNNSRSRETLM